MAVCFLRELRPCFNKVKERHAASTPTIAASAPLGCPLSAREASHKSLDEQWMDGRELLLGLRCGMTCVRLDARLHRWSYILRMLYRGTPSIPGCVTCWFLLDSLQRRTSCRLLFDQSHLRSSLVVYFDIDRPTTVSVHPTLSHSTEEQLALTSTGRITNQEIESQFNSQKTGFGPGTPEPQNHLISELQM
jgi:hypothetical protein